MTRLGILYPPAAAEYEYYQHGERLDPAVRVALVGVRISGDEDEHAPHHLHRTAALANLETSARALAPLAPGAAVWACTSGSFIDGLEHARAQVDRLCATLRCPATSTSLAFLAALETLAAEGVCVLASYPEPAADAFRHFLEAGGIRVAGMHCLAAASGPDAAALDPATFFDAATAMRVPPGHALVIPDTAVPTLDWIESLEDRLDRPLLTANQVSLWQTARLAGLDPAGVLPGRLCRG